MVESSHSSDHRDVTSSEPEMVKIATDALPQRRSSDSVPVPNTGVAEHKSTDVTIDDAFKPLSSDVSLKSSEVIEQPVNASQHPPTTISEPAVADSSKVEAGRTSEVCGEKIADDLVNDGSNADQRYDAVLRDSDSEATPKNERSVQEDDISVHLDDTLSENHTSSTLSTQSGVKPSPVDCQQPIQAELHGNDTCASKVEPGLRHASPKPVAVDAECPVDGKDAKQSLGDGGVDISASSRAAGSRPDVRHSDSPGSRPVSGSPSAALRHSASGASSGSSKACAAIDSDHSDNTSSRSASIVNSSVSSKAHTVDSDRSLRADSGSARSDIVDRQVSGRAESPRSSSSDSVRSNVSSRTFTIDSEDSGKPSDVHEAAKTSRTASLHREADVILPDDVVCRTGTDVRQRADDAGADTDDDVADLEADQSVHAKPAEKVPELVDTVPAVPHVTPAEPNEKLGTRLDEDVVNLRDERLPEELDSDSDFNEDGHGVYHSGTDARSLPKNASEPQSDTSESRSGRKSDDLHRIISKAAAAVESFVTEGQLASSKIREKVEEPSADGHCEKVAVGTTQCLLADAIDQMLAVRNHKIAAAAANMTTAPAMPLSPSALSDTVKSTASTSSTEGRVRYFFVIDLCA